MTTPRAPRNPGLESILIKAAGGQLGQSDQPSFAIALGKDDREAAKNSNSESATEGTDLGKIILPPHSLQWLSSLVDDSDELGQCISAVVQGTVGRGYRLVPNFPESVVPPELEAAVAEERARIDAFFSYAGATDDFLTISEKCMTDDSLIGNWYMEVIRNFRGEILGLEHVVGAQVHHGKLDPAPIKVKIPMRIVDASGKPIITSRDQAQRFRLFVQEAVTIFGSRATTRIAVWFKEFGDPREYHCDTGELLSTKDEINAAKADGKLAGEIIHCANYNPSGSSYGKPAFIGALYSIATSRAAEKINFSTIRNNMVPSCAILVSGGTLTAGSVKRMESFVEGSVKGNDNYSKMVLLEAESFFQDDQTTAVKIDIKPLAHLQRDDGMFLKLKQDCRDAVRASFRLPPILVGRSAEWTGAVISGARRLADEVVFAPRRSKFERVVNRRILPAINCIYHKFELNVPNTTDNAELVALLANVEKTGAVTPRIARMIVERVLGMDLPEFPPGFDADTAFSLQMAEAVKNQADPSEPGQLVTALKARGIAVALKKQLEGMVTESTE